MIDPKLRKDGIMDACMNKVFYILLKVEVSLPSPPSPSLSRLSLSFVRALNYYSAVTSYTIDLTARQFSSEADFRRRRCLVYFYFFSLSLFESAWAL